MKPRFFGSLFAALCFALEINEPAPEGGSPNPEMDATEADDDATTGINATEHEEDEAPVTAEPGTDVTEQQADGNKE